jgi:hypothetical protein
MCPKLRCGGRIEGLRLDFGHIRDSGQVELTGAAPISLAVPGATLRYGVRGDGSVLLSSRSRSGRCRRRECSAGVVGAGALMRRSKGDFIPAPSEIEVAMSRSTLPPRHTASPPRSPWSVLLDRAAGVGPRRIPRSRSRLRW